MCGNTTEITWDNMVNASVHHYTEGEPSHMKDTSQHGASESDMIASQKQERAGTRWLIALFWCIGCGLEIHQKWLTCKSIAPIVPEFLGGNWVVKKAKMKSVPAVSQLASAFCTSRDMLYLWKDSLRVRHPAKQYVILYTYTYILYNIQFINDHYDYNNCFFFI